MASMPPIGESNYPRPDLMQSHGSADKLQALGEGYFGLTKAFALNFLLIIATGVVNVATKGSPLVVLGMVGLTFLCAGICSYGPNKKIAFGLGQDPGFAILGSIVTALLYWFCFGAISYMIYQSMAIKRLRIMASRLAGFGGLKKPVFYAAVEALRAQGGNAARGISCAPADLLKSGLMSSESGPRADCQASGFASQRPGSAGAAVQPP